MNDKSVWQAQYIVELQRIRAGLFDPECEEDVEWVECQAAFRAAGLQGEEIYCQVVKRVECMRVALVEQEDDSSWSRSALRIARALCTWGIVAEDEEVYATGAHLVDQHYERIDVLLRQRADVGWWVEILRLCTAAAPGQKGANAHLLAAHSVAVLMNDFYTTETGCFLSETVPGVLEEEQGLQAELPSQLDVADGLAAEAMRCGDDRLFDWSIQRARALVVEVEGDPIAVEMMRAIGLRALLHRGDVWGRKWLESSCEKSGNETGPMRLASLALGLRSLCQQ